MKKFNFGFFILQLMKNVICTPVYYHHGLTVIPDFESGSLTSLILLLLFSKTALAVQLRSSENYRQARTIMPRHFPSKMTLAYCVLLMCYMTGLKGAFYCFEKYFWFDFLNFIYTPMYMYVCLCVCARACYMHAVPELRTLGRGEVPESFILLSLVWS